MCLALPARIIHINGLRAKVCVLECEDEVDIRLTPEVEPGDYVLIHVGFAIQTIHPEAVGELEALWSHAFPSKTATEG